MREKEGRSADSQAPPPYSSIKVSKPSLDHLLLGKAADGGIIRVYLFCWEEKFVLGSETGLPEPGRPDSL